MAEYLLELYVSRGDPAAVDRTAERARAAADALTEEGVPVRYVRSIFVPDDETCFLLYEAEGIEDVELAAQRASLGADRIAQAVTTSKGETCASGNVHP
jgi:hypothetical protein